MNEKREQWLAKQAARKKELSEQFTAAQLRYRAAAKQLKVADGEFSRASAELLSLGSKLADMLDGKCVFMDGEPRILRFDGDVVQEWHNLPDGEVSAVVA